MAFRAPYSARLPAPLLLAQNGAPPRRGEARGDWLVFLHADTRLEAGWRAAVEGVEERVVGGAFRFALDTTSPARFYLAGHDLDDDAARA